MHAQGVLADAGQTLAKRRIDQRAHKHKTEKQNHQRVNILRARDQRVEFEQPQHRHEGDAGQPVEAAGIGMGKIGGLLQQRHGAQGEHQQRQSGGPQQHQAGGQPQQRRHRAAEQQSADRLLPDAVESEHPYGIGTGAEEGGMAERDDAGITQRQIERDRKQNRHQQFGAESKVARKGKIKRNRQQPGQRLPGADAVPLGERTGGGVVEDVARCAHAVLPNRPCGRHRSRRMVSA